MKLYQSSMSAIIEGGMPADSTDQKWGGKFSSLHGTYSSIPTIWISTFCSRRETMSKKSSPSRWTENPSGSTSLNKTKYWKQTMLQYCHIVARLYYNSVYQFDSFYNLLTNRCCHGECLLREAFFVRSFPRGPAPSNFLSGSVGSYQSLPGKPNKKHVLKPRVRFGYNKACNLQYISTLRHTVAWSFW